MEYFKAPFQNEISLLAAKYRTQKLTNISSQTECLCYCCVCTKRKCDGEDREETERQEWKQRMNQVDDREQIRNRAANRQQQFHEMEQKLRQMDFEQQRRNIQ